MVSNCVNLIITLMLKTFIMAFGYKCFNKYNHTCIWRYYGYNGSSTSSFRQDLEHLDTYSSGIAGGSYNFLSFGIGN